MNRIPFLTLLALPGLMSASFAQGVDTEASSSSGQGPALAEPAQPAPNAGANSAGTLAGFNEDSLVEPLVIPSTLMLTYDPAHPLNHLDEEWTHTFIELMRSAQILMQQERFTDATFVLGQALRLAPDEPSVRNSLGAAYVQLRIFDSAAEQFSAILARDPDNWQARFNRAEMYFIDAYHPGRPGTHEGDEHGPGYRVEQLELALSEFENLRESAIDPGYSQIVNFKVFLCRLLLDDVDGADEVMADYNAYSGSPAWYMMNAALEFQVNNDSGAASEWIQSARRIFAPAEVNLYADSFIELGWAQTALDR